MKFQLGDINEWTDGLSCTPTALAALSGKTPKEIGVVLSVVATENGRAIGPELRQDYNVNDWLTVVNRLGGSWAPGDDYSERRFEERPTIQEWMKDHMGVEPELVFCDDGKEIGHVFATDDGDVVDTYTKGKREKFEGLPESYRVLRVKYSFLVD